MNFWGFSLLLALLEALLEECCDFALAHTFIVFDL